MLEIDLYKRFLPIKIGDKKVDLKPCSEKFLKNFVDWKSEEVERLPEVVKEILNNNKQGYLFKDEIIDAIESVDKIAILEAYIVV